MDLSVVRDAVDAGLSGRRLLSHPFYQRWSAGELDATELAAYAGQYRAFEAAMPGLLADVAEALGDAGELLAANLDDELGIGGTSHLELFDRFAAAVGAVSPDGVELDEATAALVDAHRALVDDDAIAGLAGLLAYETQAPEISRTKADGLRAWYGVDEVAFWDVHAAVDADHAEWALEALTLVAADAGQVTDAVEVAASAWWSFLDAREAARA